VLSWVGNPESLEVSFGSAHFCLSQQLLEAPKCILNILNVGPDLFVVMLLLEIERLIKNATRPFAIHDCNMQQNFPTILK
jgi:hypothetical protein